MACAGPGGQTNASQRDHEGKAERLQAGERLDAGKRNGVTTRTAMTPYGRRTRSLYPHIAAGAALARIIVGTLDSTTCAVFVPIFKYLAELTALTNRSHSKSIRKFESLTCLYLALGTRIFAEGGPCNRVRLRATVSAGHPAVEAWSGRAEVKPALGLDVRPA